MSFAPGIPSKQILPIPSSQKPQYWDVSIQHHLADKAGPHYDFRLSDGEHAYSWAIRKGLPLPGNKHLAVEQPTHTPDYMPFEGTLEEGYGKGEVKLEHLGKARIINSNPDKINFALISKRIPEELSLIKTNQNQWLMINRTQTKDQGIPTYKKHYKETENIDTDDPDIMLQPKIDGAHVLWDLRGQFPKVYSYRPSQYTDKLINHTYKIPNIENIEIPKDLKGLILRGELFGTKNGKAIPAQELNSFLNSNTDKSLELQKQTGIQLNTIIFDVEEDKPYKDKFNILKKVSKQIPFLELPETAETKEEKLDLISRVSSGQHPLTVEGFVAWNKNKPLPEKFKFVKDYDVYVRDIVPMIGHPEKVGGFGYSFTPKGEIVGYVGSGLSNIEREQVKPNKIAVLKAQGVFPSGALRAPVFKNWHLEKNI